MKRYFAHVVFLTLLIAAVGCNPQTADKNTRQLDSLLSVLDGAKKAAMAVSKDNLDSLMPLYNEYYAFFKNEYKPDSPDAEFFTHQLDDMQRCRKYTGKTASGLTSWRAQIDTAIKKVTALKHDYEHELWTSKEFQEHLNVEWQATYIANRNVQKYLGLAAKCARNSTELFRQLDSAKTAYLQQQ